MKYTILINQKAVIESGLDLDIVDLSILDLMITFAGNPRCKTKYHEGRPYYFFKWVLIRDQLPILKLTTRQSVYRRMKNLIDAGMIIPHEDNQVAGEAWYCFGHGFPRLTMDGPDTETLQGSNLLETHPVNNGIHIDNTIKDNTISNKNTGAASQPAPNPDDLKKKEQLDVRNRKISFLKLVIDYCSENMHKYPKLMYVDFAKYWVEQSLHKKKIKLRFEQQEFFDIGRRLSTWFKGCKDAQLSGYWDSEEKVGTLNDLFKKQILGINGNGQG